MTPDQQIAVIYARVSSGRQVKQGHGLVSQETRCREFAKYKEYQVQNVFVDKGITGGVVDRPGIREMMTWLKKNQSLSPVVIIDDISRIARGVEAHWKLRAAIASVGASLESPSIEFGDDPDSQLVENMLASVSQHHRQKNAEQVVNRMSARLRNGYFVFQAPAGYRYERAHGQGKILVPDEPVASVLREALEGFASGRFANQAEFRDFLKPYPIFSRDRAGDIRLQQVKVTLTNPIYAGYFSYEPWSVPLTKGRHEPLISYDAFQKIQQRLDARQPNLVRKDRQDAFSLRGFIQCAACGHSMTGYWAKGRAKRYAYYRCFNKACDQRNVSISRDKVETQFGALLKTLRPSVPVFTVAYRMFQDLWDQRFERLDDQRVLQERELSAVETRISRLLDRLLDSNNETTTRLYETKLRDLEQKRAELTECLAQSAEPQRNFEQAFRTAMSFLSSPWKYWDSEDLDTRRLVLKLAFQSPLQYSKKDGFRTAKTTLPFKVLEAISDVKDKVVSRTGFEPVTH